MIEITHIHPDQASLEAGRCLEDMLSLPIEGSVKLKDFAHTNYFNTLLKSLLPPQNYNS